METGKEIVVLVHGIRDFAAWQITIRNELESHGLAVELTNYERFDLLRFLVPAKRFRNTIPPDVVYRALSQNARLYRMAEVQSETKPNANHWIEQCLVHFEQRQDTRFVTECLLEQAALFLELSQIEHTDAEKFRRIAQDGDRVMARAAALANDTQRSEVYRIWSRFYYNLARPRDGLLSSNWSNNYLNLAYNKAKAAHELGANDIRNVTQLSRATQKYAANPPQDEDPHWTFELREVQKSMLLAFQARDGTLNTPRARIPPLNILGVLTMDVVRREWKEEKISAIKAIEELKDVAIARQREAWALVEHTEWAKEYRFDLNYDLARIQSVMLQIFEKERLGAEAVIAELVENFTRATDGASHKQIKAALVSVDKDPSIAGLSEPNRVRVRTIFTIQ